MSHPIGVVFLYLKGIMTRELRKKRCRQCGKMFSCPYGIGIGVWKKRKYCSSSCRKTSMKSYKKCVLCGSLFEYSSRVCRNRKTCSNECSSWYKSQIRSKKIIKKCAGCDLLFLVNTFREKSARFCSIKCRSKHYSKEKSHNWRGDVASLSAIHTWVRSHFTNIGSCEICGETFSSPHMHWSNKNHTYKRERQEWQYLCRWCHLDYDRSKGGTYVSV